MLLWTMESRIKCFTSFGTGALHQSASRSREFASHVSFCLSWSNSLVSVLLLQLLKQLVRLYCTRPQGTKSSFHLNRHWRYLSTPRSRNRISCHYHVTDTSPYFPYSSLAIHQWRTGNPRWPDGFAICESVFLRKCQSSICPCHSFFSPFSSFLFARYRRLSTRATFSAPSLFGVSFDPTFE